eukprot:350235-Chlamydomonas_euryale.AAC.11
MASECGSDLRQPFFPNASTQHDQPTARPMLTVEICKAGGGRRMHSARTPRAASTASTAVAAVCRHTSSATGAERILAAG